ncbi:3-dehydroquinate synthase [Candidatus Omnitrophota bacterium]
MMKKITVRLKKPYAIYIGQNASLDLKQRAKSLNLGNYGVVITNKTIYSLYKKRIPRIFGRNKEVSFKFHVLPDTEKAKSFGSVLKIIDDVAKTSYEKRVFFVCWGGGVIGDLGAFTASIYKRGCPVVQMPTTLLAQIDSAIGGKTAIDLKVAKNLVGSFWQPDLVLSDVSFLKTLQPSQIKEGLAEAIKYGLIKDKQLFTFLEKDYAALLAKNPAKLLKLVCRCTAIKQKVVEIDEQEEKGIRTILNFGHTVGHALEASSNYRLSHGKAIALGMIAALRVSEQEGLLQDATILPRVIKMIKHAGLPVRQTLNTAKVMRALKKDKKFIRGKMRMVLLKKIAAVRVKEGVKAESVKAGIKLVAGQKT